MLMKGSIMTDKQYRASKGEIMPDKPMEFSEVERKFFKLINLNILEEDRKAASQEYGSREYPYNVEPKPKEMSLRDKGESNE